MTEPNNGKKVAEHQRNNQRTVGEVGALRHQPSIKISRAEGKGRDEKG